MRAALLRVALGAVALVVLVVPSGCGSGPKLDASALAAADAYTRAVWVDRDCAAAGRHAGDRSLATGIWCQSERSYWRTNVLLVRHSRDVEPCGALRQAAGTRPSSASHECVGYALVGRTPTNGIESYQYTNERMLYVLGKKGGNWVVLGFGTAPRSASVCSTGDRCAAIAEWARRVPLHSAGSI
jgi:hypothetical protein